MSNPTDRPTPDELDPIGALKESLRQGTREAQLEHLKDRLRRDLNHLLGDSQPQSIQPRPAGFVTITLSPSETKALRDLLEWAANGPGSDEGGYGTTETLSNILARLPKETA